MVAGYSGTGKTALVHEIYKPITAKRGHFIEGKFDQYQRNIPYFAWGQAFYSLINSLLMENKAQLEIWKTRILKAVGINGKIITDLIPNLERIIGPQPNVPDLGGAEAQNRFSYVFQNFIQAMALKEHPMVIFLDDLQWIDAASQNLLKVLLTDPELKNVLFIGAYRENEVDATHPLMMCMNELEKNEVRLGRVEVRNLSESDVHALIADTLSCHPQESKSLARLIYSKTGGNAFFVHQMLHLLNEEKLLTFDLARQKWQWDMATLQRMKITDNVVELLSNNVRKLPMATQEALKLTACIGNKFDRKTLAIISQESEEFTRANLQIAVTRRFYIFPRRPLPLRS